MLISKVKHIEKVYTGANGRSSLLDVSYTNSDAKQPLIIFLHGFKGYKDWGAFPLLADEFAKKNFVFLKFNFSHNGGTIEDPIDFPDLDAFSRNTYSKELEDVGSVLNFVKNESEIIEIIDKNRIYLIGHSRGGAMAILAASIFSEFKKLVTLAAVDNLYHRLPNEKELADWKQNGVRYIENSRTKQRMPMNYSFVLDLLQNKSTLDVEKGCKRIQIPQLIIHGREDETVNYNSALNLKENNPQAELELIEGANHTFGSSHPYSSDLLPPHLELATDKISSFFKSSS